MVLSKTLLQDHQNFLQDHLPELLAEGWRGYQRFGRGAVILNDREAVARTGDHEENRDIEYYYYSNQQAVGSNNGWPTREVRRLVREYNPQKQVVCVFLLPDNLCAAYKTWSREVTPAEAAANIPVSDD